MPAPYPTLTISQFISPAESRGLWLSLYAAAFARGLPILESLDVATRGVIALSASVLANDPALPPWLKTYDDEAEEAPDAVAPESASARAEGSGGATIRERAIDAIETQCLGYDPPSGADVLGAIEAAGLRIVDAKEHDNTIATLRLGVRGLAERFEILAKACGLTEEMDEVCDAEGAAQHVRALRDAAFAAGDATEIALRALDDDHEDQDYPAAPGSRSGTHASGDAADDGHVHGRDTSRGSVPAASSPRAPGDASPAREGSTDRCPECRTTGAHKLDCSRGRRRYAGPAKGL